jgi:hypothetical protein
LNLLSSEDTPASVENIRKRCFEVPQVIIDETWVNVGSKSEKRRLMKDVSKNGDKRRSKMKRIEPPSDKEHVGNRVLSTQKLVMVKQEKVKQEKRRHRSKDSILCSQVDEEPGTSRSRSADTEKEAKELGPQESKRDSKRRQINDDDEGDPVSKRHKRIDDVSPKTSPLPEQQVIRQSPSLTLSSSSSLETLSEESEENEPAVKTSDQKSYTLNRKKKVRWEIGGEKERALVEGLERFKNECWPYTRILKGKIPTRFCKLDIHLSEIEYPQVFKDESNVSLKDHARTIRKRYEEEGKAGDQLPIGLRERALVRKQKMEND